jgi:pimeloyl-ACP methyl ester carboxylesterase
MRTIIGFTFAAVLGSIGVAEAKDATVKGPAGAIHVDDGGTGGVPVVFVPSYAGSTTQWNAQLDHLRKTRRAIAIDLRGHGKSDAPANNDFAIDSLADDIGAVLDDLGLPKVVLVGHSMGGSAALAYAGKHPDRIAGLVLVASPGKLPEAQGKQILAAIEADYDKTMTSYWNKLLTGAQPKVKAQVQRDMKGFKRDASMAMIKASMTYDPTPALKSFAGPKWVIIIPANKQPFDLQNLVPGVTVKEVKGTSHWIQMDKPGAVNTLLDEILASASLVARR